MERKRFNDLLTGFLEEMEEVPSAGPGSERAKAEEEDDEKPTGPDHGRSPKKNDQS